jgi:hypothetical protein
VRIVALLLTVWPMGCSRGAHSGDAVLPGECITPHALTAQESPELTRILAEADGTPLLESVDLDGDGAADQMLSSSGRCDRQRNCAYAVYLMRGTCGHYVGAIWASKARLQRTTKAPLQDIVAQTRGTGAEFEEWYRFEKGSYRCIAYREKKTYEAGRRDPLADWGAWESCEPAAGPR